MKVTVVNNITESLGRASKLTNKNVRKREKIQTMEPTVILVSTTMENVGRGTIMKMCYNFISNGSNQLIFVLNEQTHKRQQNNNNNNNSKKKLTAFSFQIKSRSHTAIRCDILSYLYRSGYLHSKHHGMTSGNCEES